MTGQDLLVDAFGRVHESVHAAVAGLTLEQLHRRLDGDANPVGWLIWHLARVQDDHVADVAGLEQAWTSQGFDAKFGSPYPAADVGYGQSSGEVGKLNVPSIEVLTAYHDAVHELTVGYVAGLTDDDFDRVVDTRWDPPVTLGVRLISVVSDTMQHVGQAAYVRGILLRDQ
ncbi:putative chorismate synthase [Catenulispora acidiphila DSM 44928]|uniref:Putative chorismate synthase n=1 Tax=Catenulispora acidiphila (strain DSM 44928 / JCM 14897 / NBRC 102108 / NRRL B-24433 / ID139908) TaxID=479433 RepID=C7Q7Z7_CATAD|nr:DinB family protein [Catenulispora acidiphila]ACU74164.1 putative chorismate synthase [Catenulispora acidiphila DSM 44928]